MLKQRSWHILHEFERRQKKLFLKKLTKNESLRIIRGLYEFAQEIGVRTAHKRLDLRKIRALSKIHSIFLKVNL